MYDLLTSIQILHQPAKSSSSQVAVLTPLPALTSLHTLGIIPQVRPPEDDISQPADEALRGVDASRSHSLVSLGGDAATAAGAAGAAPSFASSNATIVLRSEPSAAAAGRARSSISSSGIFECRSLTNFDYEI